MNLIITIDTEEDNWGRYSATDNPVTNIERLIPLQQMFDRYRVRPTYLVTYPVAVNARSVEILKTFVDQDKCEIGMHCHPWNTPPFEEDINDVNSMLCNLPEELVLRKMTTLHNAICENFGIVPVSFRSGRWGFSSAVARSLLTLGYKVDTSVTPYVDWSEYHGPDYRDFPLCPYRFSPDDLATPDDNGSLLQVPATVGFLQSNFKRCQHITSMLETNLVSKMRLKGILDRAGILNKVWLSPELADADMMIKLVEQIGAEGVPMLNMSFHSTTLKAGLSPFGSSTSNETNFINQIEKVVDYLTSDQFESMTLSQAVQVYS